jgi:hypothetical protein
VDERRSSSDTYPRRAVHKPRACHPGISHATYIARTRTRQGGALIHTRHNFAVVVWCGALCIGRVSVASGEIPEAA